MTICRLATDADRPRLGRTLRLPGSGRPIIHLYPAEEAAVRRAMAAHLPHAELVPLLVAARTKVELYRAWMAAWDDPVV